MCRWLAYSGDTVALEALVAKPTNSLIHQSRASTLGPTEINADGFGIGWYAAGDPEPGTFRSIQPAWADPNLPELARHIRSAQFVAHVRAATGAPVEPTNCHPFRHERWLWAHNGEVRDFRRVRRDLVLAVEPARFPDLEGSTDSEVLFQLALTFGLAQDPVGAVQRTVGFVEEVGRAHGVDDPLMMTAVVADGRTLWSFRYSSEGRTRTLFHSAGAAGVRALHPEVPELRDVSSGTRIVVSEPLADLPGAWVEYPESSYGVVGAGDDSVEPFRPELP